MAYKIFLDINIFLDFLDSDRKNHLEAVSVIDLAEQDIIAAFVTESVLNTIAYITRKDYNTPKLIDLLNHFLSFVRLIPVDTTMYLSGLQRTINDVEDAILYTAALHSNLDFFITSDLKDLKKLEVASLPVMPAKEFLAYYNTNK